MILVRLLIALLLVGLAAGQAAAAPPTVDAVSSTCTTASGVLSWSHTFGGTADGAIIGVSIRNAATVATITVGGSATGVAKIDGFDDADSNSAELWRVIAPGTGVKTIVVTLTDLGRNVGCAGAISLVGMHQTTPDTAHAHASNTSGSSAALTVDVASNAGELVVGLGGQSVEGNTFTSTGTGQTERIDVTAGSQSFTMATQTGASTTTHSYTASGNKEWITLAASIQPAAGGGGTTSRMMLMGVGN